MLLCDWIKFSLKKDYNFVIYIDNERYRWYNNVVIKFANFFKKCATFWGGCRLYIMDSLLAFG